VRDTRDGDDFQRYYSPVAGEPPVLAVLSDDAAGFSIVATEQPPIAIGPNGLS
jgi:hypothetical protein